ncbi:hypothetical protein HMPREF1155_0623 [Slackia sp. CM382]|nr:hypothetical protein HMPREF1155_0623 [Slackia sp. CM382]
MGFFSWVPGCARRTSREIRCGACRGVRGARQAVPRCVLSHGFALPIEPGCVLRNNVEALEARLGQRRGSQGALWEPMSKRAYTRDR